MKLKCIFLAAGICFSLQLCAQLKTPDQFLGYTLGERFTPHYKIVQYFEQARGCFAKYDET